MQCQKRGLKDQDPDYEIHEPQLKRIKVERTDEGEDVCQNVRRVIEGQFNREIKTREDQLMECQDRLFKARQNLRLLRYAITASYYKVQPSKEQTRIHPAVKKLLGSKKKEEILIDLDVPETLRDRRTETNVEATKEKPTEVVLSKIPCYVPPKEKPGALLNISSTSGRSLLGKVKKTIVVGNVSKWIPPDFRDDESTHKWMMYVRGPPDAPDISNVVERVRFFLHSSYRPHDVIEIKEAPFHLSRRGWGEFPVRVQVHFVGSQNKPIDVIHQLALDKTYSGLQTLGGETVVDAWLVESLPNVEKQLSALTKPSPVKSEPDAASEILNEPTLVNHCKPEVSPPKQIKIIHTVKQDGVPKRIIIPSLSKSTFTIPANMVNKNLGQRVFTVKSAVQLPSRPATLPKGRVSLLKPVTLKKEGGAKRVIYLKMNGNGKLVPVIAPLIQPSLIKRPVAQVQKVHSTAQLILARPGPSKPVVEPEKVDLQDKEYYAEQYKKLALKCTETFDSAAYYLLKNLPLIDKNLAENKDYLLLHPYVIPSSKIFTEMAPGKQRAHELLRAKEVLRCLQTQGFDSKNPWDIVKLSRAYGFTPMTNCSGSMVSKLVPSKVYKNCYTEGSEVINWLSSKCNNLKKLDRETVIDIECNSPPGKHKKGVEPKNSNLALEEKYPESVFVQNVAKRIGVSFTDEEANEKSSGEAEVVIYQSVLQLMEEVLRRSYQEAAKRGDNECIVLDDVQGALQQRKEFDVFRNDGLGTQLER